MSEEDKEEFGNTELGQALGCGFIILCAGIAASLLFYALSFSS